MPLYEYECTGCLRHTEKIQKFSDAEITECPHCSGRLERVLSAPAISFKGGGWYKDLYSSAKPAASGDASKGSGDSGKAASDSGPSNGSKSGGESAPAAAPAAAPASAPAMAPAANSSSKA